MTNLRFLLAAAVPAAVAIAAPAQAQVAGIAVANPEAAIARTRAWTTAKSQIETQYRTQLDQAATRERAIVAELQPLATAYQTAAQRPNADQNALRTQAQQIQQRQQTGQQELERLRGPAARAQAYALEQLTNQLRTAVDAVVRRKNVSLLLRPDAALFAQPAADITADLTTELDRLVPTVNTNPPANWQPGGQQTQQQAPQQQQPQGR